MTIAFGTSISYCGNTFRFMKDASGATRIQQTSNSDDASRQRGRPTPAMLAGLAAASASGRMLDLTA